MSEVYQKLQNLAEGGEPATKTPQFTIVEPTTSAPTEEASSMAKRKKVKARHIIIALIALNLIAMVARQFTSHRKNNTATHAVQLPSIHEISQLLAENRFDEALPKINALLSSQPKNTEALIDLAYVYKNSSRLDEAKNILLETVKLDPNSAVAFNNLGRVYAAENDWGNAVAMYKQALAIQSTYSQALINLGSAYEATHDWSSAVEAYDKFLKVDTEDLKLQKALRSRVRRLRAFQTFRANHKSKL